MTVMDPVEQRRVALRQAQETNRLYGQLRKSLRNAKVMEARAIAAHVLLEDHERFGGMKIRDLLGSIFSWGPDKIRMACKTAEVSQMARVDELTPGGRERLAGVLTGPQSMGRYTGV